ncbi:MAG: sigma-54 dependent transcriptional regulator [Woeseiaceae bacterium]|nr:sigma-54 dependent transcriptional regulator [Woeseiaceae bacterium]
MGQQIHAKVIVFDSNRERATELCHRLEYLEYTAVASDPESTLDTLKGDDGLAVVLGDLEPGDGFRTIAEQIRSKHPEIPFIRLNTGSAETGPDANWSLDVPLRRTQLERLMKRAERHHGTERRHRLTGSSASIRRVRALIDQVADFDTNVLVTGPSGTGKELVARTIHDLSERADQPFVPINCGAIPAELLESELFGHEKGAFTGAVNDRTGRFELAEGGTLFLDEIGDMSLDMQVKLLRVLQERSFEKVGSNKTRSCNVRIVAATHRDLRKMVEEGEFREDLYYRLNVYPIEMPPLLKRASDLPQLISELFTRYSGTGEAELRVSEEALQVLASYQWPGNVRELGNLVERLAIIKPEGTIEVSDLPPKYLADENRVSGQPNMVSEAVQMTCDNLKEHLSSVERELIGQAMTATGGVVAKAARLLSMRRTTLVEKLGKYQLN